MPLRSNTEGSILRYVASHNGDGVGGRGGDGRPLASNDNGGPETKQKKYGPGVFALAVLILTGGGATFFARNPDVLKKLEEAENLSLERWMDVLNDFLHPPSWL